MLARHHVACVCLALLAGLACNGERERAEAIGSTYVPLARPVLDMLLVIDDSPSMRTFTANADMAANLAAFADVIEGADVRADIRIAITTTSVAGPTCTGPFARGGELLTDTCLGLSSDAFIGPAELESESLDLQEACTDVCSLASLDRRASPVDDYETELAIRPWIEAKHNSYGGNLPSDVSLAQALVCAGMRGFGGCEHESPLAAASRALDRMRTPGDPAHGFLRDGAGLLIVFIGDEDDCSHPESSATIFDPAGSDVFWTDPAGPTSGVCHRASTACDADGCEVVDRELSGAVTDDFASAALTSLVGFEAELETLRQERDVAVALIGGVLHDGSLLWSAPTPEHAARVAEFGWGPGCIDAAGRVAQPPGRLYQLAHTFAVSICQGDWSAVIEILDGDTDQWLKPWYAPLGIADAEPTLPGLQPACELRVRTAVDELLPIPPCLRDEQGWIIDPETLDYTPPQGAERCWAWLADPGGQTDDPYDDLSPEALGQGYPAEFVVAARPDTYLPRGSVYESVCTPE